MANKRSQSRTVISLTNYLRHKSLTTQNSLLTSAHTCHSKFLGKEDNKEMVAIVDTWLRPGLVMTLGESQYTCCHLVSLLWVYILLTLPRHRAHYGNTWRRPQNRKFITYCNAVISKIWLQATSTDNSVKFGSVVFEICSLTARQTCKQTDTLITILNKSSSK